MYKTGKGLIAPSFRHFSLPLREDAKFRLHSYRYSPRSYYTNKQKLGNQEETKGRISCELNLA